VPLTKAATVAERAVHLGLRCGGATCRGVIKLWDGAVLVATATYGLSASTTGTVALHLTNTDMKLLAAAKGHTLEVGETVTVARGTTVREHIKLLS
jgi:hypothetical protein